MASSLPTNQTLKSFLPLILSAVGTTIATVSLVTMLVQTQITGMGERTQSQLTSIQAQITQLDERMQSRFVNVNTAIESVRYDSDK